MRIAAGSAAPGNGGGLHVTGAGSEVRILGGLDAGALVAVSGVHQLREGATVRRLER